MFRGRIAVAAGCAALLTVPLLAAEKAAPVSLESVIRKVQDQQKKMQTLQAGFRQEKVLALLSEPEVSSGRFAFSRPNNVLWSYDSPRRVEMLIANGTMTTWFPDLNRAERVDMRRFEGRFFKYMGASWTIDELIRYFDFTFTDTSTNPFWVLDLKPKTRAVARRVRSIRIWIEKETYLTSKFEYVEGDGDITRYEFTDIRINQPIAQARFTLDLPANVKIEQMKIQ